MSTTLPELPPMRIRRHFVHCAVFDPTSGHCDCGSLPKAYDAGDLHAYGLAVWKAAMQQAARELEKIACIVSGPHESDGQYALLNACASALRSLPLPEQGGPQ